MRRAQDGDRQAYESLLIEITAIVRSFVRRRIAHADQVEDIVQETLLAIHRGRHTYDPKRPFQPWMYAIARHRLFDFVNRQRRRSTHEIAGEVGWQAASAAVAIDSGSSLQFLQRALALLSSKQREIIQMLKLDGRSVAEIARETGLSESSVKVTAHRGYKHLRKVIVRSDDDE
jgi:RNA polymerase sigma-70 factor (ECF subfamily)